MGERTGIAWTDHTWSPWIGCTEVSPGCDNCYARELDKRHRFGGGVHWGAGVPRYRTKDWKKPLSWNRAAEKLGVRRTVFPSLCDPFDNEVPPRWRMEFFDLIGQTPHLIWLLLTKRIGNAERYVPWSLSPPPNVWLGASVVNQAEADRDLAKLLATPATKRFVSYEPGLGPADFSRWLPDPALAHLLATFPAGAFPLPAHLTPRAMLDWIIVGGESSQGGVKARPFDVAWARQTVAQCKAAGVPVFVKQLGSSFCDTENGIAGAGWAHDQHHLSLIREGSISRPTYLRDRAGADPAEWPEDLRVQEFP